MFGSGIKVQENTSIKLMEEETKRWTKKRLHCTCNFIVSDFFENCTMLQKLSKCEVKVAQYGHFSNLLPLRCYVKSNFGELTRSKNVIFANFRDSELWNLVNLELKNCSNLLKSQFRTSKIGKIGKIGIFWALDFIKIWFHVKSEWL